MLPRRALGPYLLLAWFQATGCGPDHGPQTAAVEAAIVNGTPDTSPAHQAVVWITNGEAFCSGTLITPEVVLTAGHCVYRPAASHTVGFGATWYSNVRRGVSEALRHPDYDPQYALNDIALLRLSQPAPAGTTPIAYLPESLALGWDDVGQPLEYVGFGETETGDTGTKLHVITELKWICTEPGGCAYSGDVLALPNTICQEQIEGGPCSGDSGGPALFVRAGREYVAGIVSYGPQESCFSWGCSTKVDAFEDFILGFIGGGLGSPCTGDSDCVKGVCAEGVCCETACDGACRSCRVAGHEGTCHVRPNGDSCSDGDACNGEEVCLLGDCAPGSVPDCDDGLPCTQDGCDPTRGCLNEPQPDGYACGECQMCQAGACVPADCGGGCAQVPVEPGDGTWLGLLILAGWLRRPGSGERHAKRA